MLRVRPGFAAVLVLSLGVSVATNTTLFAIVNTILFRPLPYRDSGELVAVHETNNRGDLSGVSPANFDEWRGHNRSFQSAAATVRSGFIFADRDETRVIFGFRVSATYFDVLGVHARLGRTFLRSEDEPQADPVVVLSYGFWQRLSRDPALIGQKLILSNERYTVIGVMPPDFWGGQSNTDFWVPLRFSAPERASRTRPYLAVIARLKVGISLAHAESEMLGITDQLQQQSSTTIENHGVRMLSLAESYRPSYLSTLLMIQGAAGFVLLIACANAGHLFLVGLTARRKEFAVRAALGAGRLGLIRQLLMECLVLAAMGGAAGLPLATASIHFVSAQLPKRILQSLPLADLEKIGVDLHVVAFTMALSVIAALAFGLVPAISASKADLNEALKESQSSLGISRRRHIVGRVLIAGEVAVSLVLLIGAGLFLKSVVGIQQIDIGYNPTGVVGIGIDLPSWREGDIRRKLAFYTELLDRVRAVPGVSSASLGQGNTMGEASLQGPEFTIAGQPVSAVRRQALLCSIEAAYFRTLGIPLLAGRQFDSTDARESLPVAVISQSAARHYWRDENPLGRQIRVGPPQSDEPWLTIVGVVGDVRNPLLAGPQPIVYRLLWQNPNPSGDLVLRTSIDPKAVVPAIRKVIRSLDPGIPDIGATTSSETLSDITSQPRFSTSLLTFAAGLALLLVAIGVYGVTHYLVAQRSHEIGVRMSLGAQRTDILLLILRSGAKTAAVGVGLGAIGASALSRVLASQLYGVSPTDPSIYFGLSLLLLGVSLVANLVPACRATRIEPLAALRHG
jgi:putative ABC transport system permease protein